MPDTRVTCLKGRIRDVGPALDLPGGEGLIYIGRGASQGGWRLPASDWANPFRAQKVGGAERAVELYRAWLLTDRPDLLARLPELRGRTLACWCKTGPCHGQVLAELADRGTRHPVTGGAR